MVYSDVSFDMQYDHFIPITSLVFTSLQSPAHGIPELDVEKISVTDEAHIRLAG